jgi:transposase
LRDVFNAARWSARTCIQWDILPHDLLPWQAVYQQTRRWVANGVFAEIVDDLRVLLRLAERYSAQTSVAIFDSRTLQSTAQSSL